jgi:hypothetical protein
LTGIFLLFTSLPVRQAGVTPFYSWINIQHLYNKDPIKLFMQLSVPKVLFIRIYKNFLPVSWFYVLLTNFKEEDICAPSALLPLFLHTDDADWMDQHRIFSIYQAINDMDQCKIRCIRVICVLKKLMRL